MPEIPDFPELLRAALTPRQSTLLRDLGALASELETPAFLVGGAVRDVMLGTPIDDLDVVVAGDAHALGRALASRFGGELVLHDAFGTANWRPPSGEDVDLITARSEVYPEPAALPVVTPSTLSDDLARRDFTVNAMAFSLSPDAWADLVDPFDGQSDLSLGLIRILHPASFIDDPTRAWRAARFAARLGFQLAPDTRRALDTARSDGSLARLGLERLGNELKYALQEADVLRVFELADTWGLLSWIHPDLNSSDLLGSLEIARDDTGALAEEVYWLVLSAQLPADERERLSRLVPGGGARRKRWLLGPDKVNQAFQGFRTRDPSNSEIAQALKPLDEVELAYMWVTLGELGGWLTWWEDTGRHIRCAVDGRALIAAGVQPGPIIGEALHAAQVAAWDGADAAEQLDAALQHVAKQGTIR